MMKIKRQQKTIFHLEIKEIFDFIYVNQLPVEEPDLVKSLCLTFLFPMIT